MGIKCLNESHGADFQLFHADCVDVLNQLPDNAIHFSIYSPPFGSLFTYSDSIADLCNSSCDGEFFTHYAFVVEQLLRIIKPGRLVAVHCSDLPTRKWVDGEIGLSPFSDLLSACHVKAGFILHSRVTIWRDPVVEMQRTKALGLLYKQLRKDSAMSRVGMADYVLVFRKPGENAEPIFSQAGRVPGRALAAMGLSRVDGYRPNRRSERSHGARGTRRAPPLPAPIAADRACAGPLVKPWRRDSVTVRRDRQ